MHKAWDHCAIIDEWAVESLKTVIDDGSHASFLLIAYWGSREVNLYFMETLLNLSANVNRGYNTRNTNLLLEGCVQLFNYVLPQNKGGKILLQLEGQGDTQIVGVAFSYGAIMFDNGDPSVNSVMAENAFYCLAKSIKAGNNYAAPILLYMLEHNPDAIFDKFYEVEKSKCFGSLRAISSSNSKEAVYRNKFCENIMYIKFYIISIFYDIREKRLLIPDDMLRSPMSKINSVIIIAMRKKEYEDAIKIGSDYFEKIYIEINDTLLNF